jgi:hypothetical protein
MVRVFKCGYEPSGFLKKIKEIEKRERREFLD